MYRLVHSGDLQPYANTISLNMLLLQCTDIFNLERSEVIYSNEAEGQPFLNLIYKRQFLFTTLKKFLGRKSGGTEKKQNPATYVYVC